MLCSGWSWVWSNFYTETADEAQKIQGHEYFFSFFFFFIYSCLAIHDRYFWVSRKVSSAAREKIKMATAAVEKATEKPVEEKKLLGDYSHEPSRWEKFVVNASQPFNAETPPSELIQEFITPTEKFYVRSHGPAPDIDVTKYWVTFGGLINPPRAMSLQVRER